MDEKHPAQPAPGREHPSPENEGPGAPPSKSKPSVQRDAEKPLSRPLDRKDRELPGEATIGRT